MAVWCYSEVDYVVAGSAEEAEALLQVATGYEAEDMAGWAECPSWKPFGIAFKNGVVTHGTMCDPKEPGAVEVTKTMDEWARAMGPGYLCTTEFQED